MRTSFLTTNSLEQRNFSKELTFDFVSRLGFFFLLLSVAAIIYFDDIQIAKHSTDEAPTIYNIRIVGLKIIDLISLSLFGILIIYLLIRKEFEITFFHRFIFTIITIYLYAGIVGFLYSFFLQYDYLIWIQDFQAVIYFIGFFLLTFYFVNTSYRWKIFVICLLIFMAVKNIIITYRTFTGQGLVFTDWALRASQNSEFAYFPMMFFPFFALFINKKNIVLRIAIAIVLFIYLFNSLIGIYRTVWVMLMLGSLYFFYFLDRKTRRNTFLIFTAFFVTVLFIISIYFPRFLDLAWNYKFASIFEWKVYGDRSNATRVLEIENVWNYVFRHYAFLQGMGLGAYWDDLARRLLPDGGSGFMYRNRFHTTHMLMLTQILKLGLVATAIYWLKLLKVLKFVAKKLQEMSWSQWEKNVLVGLHVGFVCVYISNADFVRLFTMAGINLGVTASYFFFINSIEKSSRSTTLLLS